MRISDWSSDVCSSDLQRTVTDRGLDVAVVAGGERLLEIDKHHDPELGGDAGERDEPDRARDRLVIAEQIEQPQAAEIGRASCRAGVGQYVDISVVAVSVQKKIDKKTTQSQQPK